MEDLQFVFMISSHELFIKLLKDDERKLLIDQMRKRSPRINLCTKPVTSFYDIPGNFHSILINCRQCPISMMRTLRLQSAGLFSKKFRMFLERVLPVVGWCMSCLFKKLAATCLFLKRV